MRHAKRDKYGRFTPKTDRTDTGKKRSVAKVGRKVKSKTTKEAHDLFIIDSSGSMATVLKPTIDGFNEVLGNIKKTSLKEGISSYITYVDFNSSAELRYMKRSVVDTKPLDMSTYRPQGMTALYDAIATGINALRPNITNKNASVTVYVFTDGEENASRHYNNQQIRELIQDVRDNLKWTVTFVGAGDLTDVKAVASSIGIFDANTLNYAAGAEGTTKAFNKMSQSRSVSMTNYAATGTVTNDGFFSND